LESSPSGRQVVETGFSFNSEKQPKRNRRLAVEIAAEIETRTKAASGKEPEERSDSEKEALAKSSPVNSEEKAPFELPTKAHIEPPARPNTKICPSMFQRHFRASKDKKEETRYSLGFLWDTFGLMRKFLIRQKTKAER
jgi:hypothetical protein